MSIREIEPSAADPKPNLMLAVEEPVGSESQLVASCIDWIISGVSTEKQLRLHASRSFCGQPQSIAEINCFDADLKSDAALQGGFFVGGAGQRNPLKFVMTYGIAMMVSFAAYADGPAVSSVNGKISLEGGAVDANNNGRSGFGMMDGSVTMPVGYSFGLQVDAGAANAYNKFLGGGATQFFWRDPQLGLLGAFTSAGTIRGNTVSRSGGEAQYFAGPLTFGAFGGYQAVSSIAPADGGFATGSLTYYPNPDLAVSGEGGTVVGKGLVGIKFEYQPEVRNSRFMSLFVSGNAGSEGSYSVTAGIRFFFGPEKTLIQRHREDDPASQTPTNPNAGLFAGTGGKGGNAGLLGGTGGNGGNAGVGQLLR